jgi:Lar family restriction alleviation protein
MTKGKATEIVLRPCPFCGEPAAWGEGEQKIKYGNEQVYCSNCYAMTAPEGSKEEAAFLWNDRNDPGATLESKRDQLLAEVARLREALGPFAQLALENRQLSDYGQDGFIECRIRATDLVAAHQAILRTRAALSSEKE